MRIFLSWSGADSKAIATVLREWLPLVLQAVEPWMSSEDIAKGSQWTAGLTNSIRESKFAIICVTASNAFEPWINFETGALAFSYTEGRVSPLLVGLGPDEIPATLSQFQCTRFEKDDIRKLLQSINECQEKPLSPQLLGKGFELAWPDLDARLRQIRPGDRAVSKRSPSKMSPGQIDLDSDQKDILALLGKNPNSRITAEDIAGYMSQHVTKVKYHLDRLAKLDYVIVLLNLVTPNRYVLSEKGRAYVVEKDLL